MTPIDLSHLPAKCDYCGGKKGAVPSPCRCTYLEAFLDELYGDTDYTFYYMKQQDMLRMYENEILRAKYEKGELVDAHPS